MDQSGKNPAPNTSNSAPVVKKSKSGMCFYPQGVRIIGDSALGLNSAILIFVTPLMTTKITIVFRHKGLHQPLMTPQSHCNNERSQFSASVPPIETYPPIPIPDPFRRERLISYAVISMDQIHGSDPWISSMDQSHGADPWI